MAVHGLGVALMGLVLGVAEFAGPRRWRWLLSDEDTGQPLADHQVSLDGEPEDFEAFTGLYRYLRWNAVPDRRVASEAEIVARVGTWAGVQVLGEQIAQAIIDAAPVTVRVEVPAQAGFILGWPLELARAGAAAGGAGRCDPRLRSRGSIAYSAVDEAVSGRGADAGGV